MLNRVLRHNLRNAINIVHGNLQLVALDNGNDDGDNDADRYVERVLDAAERISELPECVKYIERAHKMDAADFGDSDLAELVDEAAEWAAAQNSDAKMAADVPHVRVRGDRLLGVAIAELLENAVTHAGDDPSVTVSTSVDDDHVTLRISDDGAGIPQLERDVIAGHTDITQLTHSRGLGLWVAYHTVTSLGGDLSFADPSTVVLELSHKE